MRKFSFAVVLLTLGCFGYAQAATTPKKASIEEFEKSVLALISEGKQAEAETLVDSAGEDFSRYQRYTFIKACLLRSRFLVEDAEPLFNEVILAYPYNTTGYASFLIRELDRGVSRDSNWTELKKLSADNSGNVWVKWMLGVEARNLGKNKEGVEIYTDLLASQEVGTSLMHQTFANLLDEMGNYALALNHRQKVLDLEDSGWARDGLANTLVHLERLEEAIENYKKAIELNPKGTNAMVNFGLLLNRQTRFAEADEIFSTAAGLDPNWDKIWYNWGVALKGLGRKSEALEKFTKTLQLNPKHSSAGREIKALETP